jgi:2-hydroxy-3-oxopropionate reductase
MNIGFIGLGIMGKPMALNLLKAGFPVKVYDIDEKARDVVVTAGATDARIPMEAAQESDIIITMLPNASIVESVLFGDDGVEKSINKGAIVLDMSSVSPVDTVKWADKFKNIGVSFIDAPVSGGEPKAIDGTMSIMAGGSKEAFQKVLPILQVMGKEITLVGDVGSGSTTKLANQILVNVTIAAMSEAVVLASKAGVDVEKMYQAIRSGLAGSSVLDAKIPHILDRNFAPGGRIDINHKDLMNVLKAGRSIGTPMPLTASVADMFQALIENGKRTDDHSGLIQYYEKLANYEVPRGGKHNE